MCTKFYQYWLILAPQNSPENKNQEMFGKEAMVKSQKIVGFYGKDGKAVLGMGPPLFLSGFKVKNP